MQLIHFLTSEPAPKTLKRHVMHSQVHRGISLIVLPLPSERVGERLFGVVSQASSGICFRLFEISLQIIRHYCSQINSLSLKIAFVTYRESVSYKEACKRCPFALQNMPFYTSKDALLHCKRASFRTQKGVDGKRKEKNLTKKGGTKKREAASPYGLPKPLQGEGMCLAGYGMLGVGDIKEKRIKPQRLRFNSQCCRVQSSN